MYVYCGLLKEKVIEEIPCPSAPISDKLVAQGKCYVRSSLVTLLQNEILSRGAAYHLLVQAN